MTRTNTTLKKATASSEKALLGPSPAVAVLKVPLDQRPPPQIAPPVKNTLDALRLTEERPEPIFQAWLLHYGTNLVAHAVLLERAAEVLTGERSRQSFMDSLQGPSPLQYKYNEGKELIGSLRQLGQKFYIPPCAFQDAKTLRERPDSPIVFFSVDLANLFFEPARDSKTRPSFGGMDKYTESIRTLDDVLQWQTIHTGLRLVSEGFGKAVEAYTRDLVEKRVGGPLGAASLAHHYQDLIEFYGARARDLMDHRRVPVKSRRLTSP